MLDMNSRVIDGKPTVQNGCYPTRQMRKDLMCRPNAALVSIKLVLLVQGSLQVDQELQARLGRRITAGKALALALHA